MQTLTIHVPDERVSEFYIRFGEFLSSPAAPTPPALIGETGLTIPAWVRDEQAPAMASQLWNALSDSVQDVFRVLIDGAMEADGPQRYTPDELAQRAKVAHGDRGIAGMLGAAGKAIRKVGLPVYKIDGGNTWHCVWHWHQGLYSMDREVAELLRQHT